MLVAKKLVAGISPFTLSGDTPMFTIKVKTGNDAFTPDPTPEIVRILRDTVQKIEFYGLEGLLRMTGTILDTNGTAVGKITFTKD